MLSFSLFETKIIIYTVWNNSTRTNKGKINGGITPKTRTTLQSKTFLYNTILNLNKVSLLSLQLIFKKKLMSTEVQKINIT